MPGMMDTILNLGLNDKTVEALANKTSNGRFAKDSYRRFIQMYGNVVMGVEGYHFEELIENYKLTKGVLLDTELDEEDWDDLIKDFKNTVKEKTKKDFPQDVYEQLFGAICAVFLSWESNRAKVYRKLNHIPQSGEQQSMFNLWFLEIWVMIVQQELYLQEILQMDQMIFMVSI